MEAKPDPSGRRTRVFFVDDSRDIVTLYARLIETQPDMEVAGTLHTAAGLADEVERSKADVAVVDLTMPGDDPLAAMREVSNRRSACRLLAFSGYDDPVTRDRVISAGAVELVSKNGDPHEILRAIRRAAARKPEGRGT